MPYKELLDVTVMKRLMERTHPTRPEKEIPIGRKSSDALWALMTRCWEKDPLQRPSALWAENEVGASK